MFYYKVLQDFYNGGDCLIHNELITKSEMKRLHKHLIPDRLIRKGIIELVEVSSHKTYWLLGCRFEIK